MVNSTLLSSGSRIRVVKLSSDPFGGAVAVKYLSRTTRLEMRFLWAVVIPRNSSATRSGSGPRKPRHRRAIRPQRQERLSMTKVLGSGVSPRARRQVRRSRRRRPSRVRRANSPWSVLKGNRRAVRWPASSASTTSTSPSTSANASHGPGDALARRTAVPLVRGLGGVEDDCAMACRNAGNLPKDNRTGPSLWRDRQRPGCGLLGSCFRP